MKSIAQLRAQYALKKVEEIEKKYSNLNNKNYKSFVAGCPTMILQNGLGQALAFWAAKSKQDENKKEALPSQASISTPDFTAKSKQDENKKEGHIIEVIRNWFNSQDNQWRIENNDMKDFITKLMEKNQNEFVLIQKETLLMLEWYKRYANAFLKEEASNTGGE